MSDNILFTQELIGRSDDIARCWSTLQERSALLTGPRRVGKTELLKHLAAHPERGWCVERIDVQGLDSVEGAVERTLGRLAARGLGEAAIERASERVEEASIAGVGIKVRSREVEPPLSRLESGLSRAVQKLESQQHSFLLICFDEVPWWLDSVVAREGASADLNDITPAMELRPLSEAAGMALFETEVTSRGRVVSAAASRRAHQIAGGFPHWIKVLAERAALRRARGTPVDLPQIEEVVGELLSPRSRDLFADEGSEHFSRRPEGGGARFRSAVLSAAAEQDAGAPENALIAAALQAGASDRGAAYEALLSLVDAWHIDQDPETGNYRFLLPLFRLWWLRHGERP